MNRNCKLDSCGHEFEPPPTAPHKVFCSELCRKVWHWQNRKRALRVLAELKQILPAGEIKQ